MIMIMALMQNTHCYDYDYGDHDNNIDPNDHDYDHHDQDIDPKWSGL